MLCTFERLLYPQSVRSIEPGSYMVAVYRPCEQVYDQIGNLVKQIKAVGYCLPISENLKFDIQGKWIKNPKFGLQYEVDSYEEIIIPSKDNILSYLTSGQIKGIGPVIAERIYQTFGDKTLDILDNDPKQLLSIHGISQGKLQKICDSYLANRGARDVVAFLTPHGITANRAVRLYKEYGSRAMEIVQKHPYQLCELAGIGFATADKIALNMGVSRTSTERVDEGLIYTLADAEGKGHLCMEKHAYINACMKLLDTPELTEEMLANRAYMLVQSGRLVSYQGNAYRRKTAKAEESLALMIHQRLKDSHQYFNGDMDAELDLEEARLNLKLAPEQRSAVNVALSNGLSIITGGPGTGKTLIQRAILDIYRKKNPSKEICCCAPTGRAARRMEQSTGHQASTVHKALNLFAGDDGFFSEPTPLDADLILVDEVSMLDIYLAGHLFEALKKGSQLVLIGDADQLPSVGPGAVLSELIASGCIPVVRLDKVFRQNAGSRIAINAKLIRHGNLNLEYGTDFQFIDSPEIAESADYIANLYTQEIQKYGVDNVVLLSPYRQKTETGVNALNTYIQQMVNPAVPDKKEVAVGKRTFREGDKVMQIKNFEDVSNGDVGYVKRIVPLGNESAIFIDFGDNRIKEYDTSDLEMLDLGYASTIHKSQGSEYKSVIINLQCAHSIMLTRPLIYTAITRGKDKVTIVGERRAMCIAIKRTDTEKRGTCLAHRLQELDINERM